MSRTLKVRNFAHIRLAEIEFGDLTVLVGPQAAGKSLILQLLKLAIDGRVIAETMKRYGLVTRKKPAPFLGRYFGEGMEKTWSPKTRVTWRGDRVEVATLAKAPRRGPHAVYYVPAHRTLILSEGYPPTFQQFRPETPFVVRHFSEEVRRLLVEGLATELLFPQPKRLKGLVREKIDEAIFHGATLQDDASGIQRQLRLKYGSRANLAYMTWTAGQREFIPLLLGLYYLLPAGRWSKQDDTDWVIVEEPEMGLHPKGIMALMLVVLDLMSRGYRVILSTHSPLVLDVIWAIRQIREHDPRWQPVLKLFGIEGVTKASAAGEVLMAEQALRKTYKVYLLDFWRQHVYSHDISSLDPGSGESKISGWGGLTGFSGHIGSVVSEAVERGQRERS